MRGTTQADMTTTLRMSSVSATRIRMYGTISRLNLPGGIGQVCGEVML